MYSVVHQTGLHTLYTIQRVHGALRHYLTPNKVKFRFKSIDIRVRLWQPPLTGPLLGLIKRKVKKSGKVLSPSYRKSSTDSKGGLQRMQIQKSPTYRNL